MKVVSVIPISRGIAKEELSYFTTEALNQGALVAVPMRNKEVPALVVEVADAREKKALLRGATYETRKITRVLSQHVFSKQFIQTTRDTARYFATTTGAVLNSLVPKNIVEEPIHHNTKSKNNIKNITPTTLQDTDDGRFAEYVKMIKNAQAKGRSVFIVLPTIEEAHKIYNRFVEEHNKKSVFLIYGTLPKKKLLSVWKDATTRTKPVLVVGTATILSLARNDIGTVIVDHEHSRHYKQQVRPFLDVRVVAELFAQNTGCALVFGDAVLLTETTWRLKRGQLTSCHAPTTHYKTSAKQLTVDMSQYKSLPNKELQTISDELAQLITDYPKEHVFVLATRRGLAPTTVCNDCGHTVNCAKCASPVVLHSSGLHNMFVCHRCGTSRNAKERCLNCTSWNLKALGVGIERVLKDLAWELPTTSLFRIDRDTTKTQKQALAVGTEWLNTAGGILVGTEMALPFLKPVEHIAVASVDSLFSVPDFRINERLFHILLSLRLLSQKTFLIQTRNPDQKILAFALEGDTDAFYEHEIKERKVFDYPPFRTLIKLSTQGTSSTVQNMSNHMTEMFKEYQPIAYPAFVSHAKGTHIAHVLLSVPRGQWVDETLLRKLRQLPPSITIDIEPQSTL